VSAWLAAAVVRLRYAVVAVWIAGVVAATVLLPGIGDTADEGLGGLVPAGADAIDAEVRSAELFAFPFISRTWVVERDPEGLPAERLAAVAGEVITINRGQGEDDRIRAAYLLPNAIGPEAFARERGTAVLVPLIFGPETGGGARTRSAERFARERLAPAAAPGAYIGVTGTVPANDEQGDVIAEHLHLLELATVIFVSIAVAVYVRSLVAPLVALAAVGVAYGMSVRVMSAAGEVVDIAVPAEIAPIVVALLFGVVTDYVLFFVSRLRRHLQQGLPGPAAAEAASRELTPILVACGLAVAAGCLALLVAKLGFLRAFGPALAITVLVGLAVALTFVPAVLAILGRRLLWPGHLRAEQGGGPRARRAERVQRAAVRRPVVTILVCLAGLGVLSSGLAWLDLGWPLMRGLPSDSEPRVAYAQAGQGFASGAVAPTVLVAEAAGIGARRSELESLQAVLGNQAGVAAVAGPAANPTGGAFGAVLSRDGDAARFVLFLRDDPLGSVAVRRLANLRVRLDDLSDAVGLEGVRWSVAGDTALVQETIEDATGDLWRVAPAVLLAIALVLIVFLRGLVAPLYLVAIAALGPLAATGLTVAVFQGLLGHGELTYFVPIAAGVLLVALGSDYNIFLVGRIWAEAETRPLREAIVIGGAGAARAISAAGIVLAASFAATVLVPLQAFRELAFLLAAGLLIDAFLVRSILVPAVIALAGPRSGWPGHRLKRVGPRARRAVVAERRPHRDLAATTRVPRVVVARRSDA
jgi:putative drug exporter of the RND superfamily